MSAELWIIGTPLDEKKISSRGAEVLSSVDLVIGESRKMTERYLKGIPVKDVAYLDGISDRDLKELVSKVRSLAKTKSKVALFSDSGMPILFDPGLEILTEARRAGYQVRTAPEATSWGTAAAVSGFSPPFLVVGFLPREGAARQEALKKLPTLYPIVLMDTPYRFRALLKDCKDVLGRDRAAFLSWEIAKREERQSWGTLEELEKQADREGLQKGEFILVVNCR